MQIGSESVFAGRQNMETMKLDAYRRMPYKNMDDKKLREVSREFESIFVNQLFKSMRSTFPKDELLDGGMRKDIFEDMLYDEYAKKVSHAGGIGLGDMVYRFLKTENKIEKSGQA